jgi:ABC-type transport system substrate-binding protein
MRHSSLLVLIVILAGCGEVWNNPYPAQDKGGNILYSAFTERPKHLDPVQSYSEDEITFTAQIYEPPLQYHYLKRPYTLVPGTAAEVPKPQYFSADGKRLPVDADEKKIASTVYEIRIQPGILYQPHAAFALDAKGDFRYHRLTQDELKPIRELRDFRETGSRELIADDYVYEIKRLAHPRLHSPIFGLMADYIVGMKELAEELRRHNQALPPERKDEWIDLRRFPLAGVEALDRHTYRIRIRGKYPQFPYWLAMPFFAPLPWEADRFHAQPGMAERNLTLDWYPIGTGPYMLVENNPNSRMVLERNPNYRGEAYPAEGEPDDRAAGLLSDAGKAMPFIDRVVFVREKESIPYWNKFLQGYYDAAGISSDNFDQAVQLSSQGDIAISDSMRAQGIRLSASVDTSVSYMGFNMLDPVVGGKSEQARKLRQALSVAIDQEEFISVFLNGRGIPAMGPLPPGIFGHAGGRAGINPYMYDWVGNAPQRKSVAAARKLLAEAGYPNGRDEKTGEPLVINLDTTSAGLGDKARIDWMAKQLAKIDVQLNVRSTDYNRFQEKVRKGTVQLFRWGWNADYPDPENMLFLLHGPQGKVAAGGENAANYANPEYDELFERMKNMENGRERQAIIERMVAILQRDAPWVWGFYPKTYALTHAWIFNRKPNKVAHNTLKYQRIDAALREKKRAEWNGVVLWPLGLAALALVLGLLPAFLGYRRHEKARAV